MLLQPKGCAPCSTTGTREKQRPFAASLPTGRIRQHLRQSAPRHVRRHANQQGPGVSTATVDAADGASTVQGDSKLEVTLRGVEALQTVRFGLVPQGKGQAVVVTEVAEGSRAEQLGVRRGQKLNGLSDPMRYGTMWSLEDRPSLRFVVDTLKMRRASPVDLEFAPLLSEADMDAIFGSVDAAAAAGGSYSGSTARAVPASPGDASGANGDSSDSGRGAADAQAEGAAASISSIEQLTGTASSSGSDSDGEFAGMTIGERLAAKRAAALRAQMSNNQVQARIERRKAYMEIDDQRDDTGLILGLAAAFLLPAAIILLVAYFNGYLDRLYLTALTLR